MKRDCFTLSDLLIVEDEEEAGDVYVYARVWRRWAAKQKEQQSGGEVEPQTGINKFLRVFMGDEGRGTGGGTVFFPHTAWRDVVSVSTETEISD